MAELNEILTITDNKGKERTLKIVAKALLDGKDYVLFCDEAHDDLFVAEDIGETYNFDLEDHILAQLSQLWSNVFIKAVVCIDIGDGTCTAHAMRIDDVNPSQFRPELLMLDDKKNQEIAAALYYHQGGSIEIGYWEQALPEGTKCITNFKKCPPYKKGNVESWATGNRDMTPTNADKPDEEPRFPPFSENMADFIKKLWKNIKRLNSSGARALTDIADDKIAIFVGCPSSGNWSEPDQRAQYEALIRDATGIANVTVVPESTAGICREIRSRKGNMDLSGRVVVLDFGSSTMDFTCIDNGKITERSWTLGASQIERLILRKLCDKLLLQKQNKLREIEDDVRKIADLNTSAGRAYLEKQRAPVLKQIDLLDDYLMNPPGHVILKLRKEVKEHYYNTLAQNRKDGIAKTSFPYSFEGMGSVIIDDTFMKDVVAYMPIVRVDEGGDSQKELYPDGASWMDHCKKILEIIRDDNIGSGKFRLVITGGASKMDFIRPLCAFVFGDMLGEKISDDPAPQDCVSYGLCQVAMNKFITEEIIEKKKESFLEEEFSEPAVACRSIYLDISRYISRCFESILRAEMQGKNQTGILDDMKFEDFKNLVNDQMKKSLKQAEIRKILSQHKNAFEAAMNQKYRKLEQEVSTELYGHNVYVGYEFCLPERDLDFSGVDFSSGLDMKDFLTKQELRKFLAQGGLVVSPVDPFAGLKMAWSAAKSIGKYLLDVEEVPAKKTVIHPGLYLQSSRNSNFVSAASSVTEQLGLPYIHRLSDKMDLVRSGKFRDKLVTDVEQIVKLIALQN